MIKSMTGFGRSEAAFEGGKFVVDVKTVNHKFLDISLKLPEGMYALEDNIKDIVQKDLKRGKIYLSLSFEGDIKRDEHVKVNNALAKSYYKELSKLKKSLGIKEEVSLKDIITLPGVVNYTPRETALSKLWKAVEEALKKALKKLVLDREKEGRLLCRDLARRSKIIDKMVTGIEKRAKVSIEDYRKKFAQKIKDLTNGRQVDMGRLEIEAAIYAKSSDVSEEITRLKSHLINFNGTISGDGEVGKKLDFIAQELHREINTIGSKASDFAVSKNVIEMKSEVEKIREQVKNLE